MLCSSAAVLYFLVHCHEGGDCSGGVGPSLSSSPPSSFWTRTLCAVIRSCDGRDCSGAVCAVDASAAKLACSVRAWNVGHYFSWILVPGSHLFGDWVACLNPGSRLKMDTAMCPSHPAVPFSVWERKAWFDSGFKFCVSLLSL